MDGLSDRLSYSLYRAAEAAVGVLPRRTAYRLASFGADAALTLAPGRFRGLRGNLGRVRPELSDRDLSRLVRTNLRNVARCWVDVMEMRWRGDQFPDRLDVIEGFSHYADALSRGDGVVVVSIHYGSWETGLASWNRAGGELALLAEAIHPPELGERILGGRIGLGVKIIPLDAKRMRTSDATTARRLGAHAMRDVIRHLRGGGTIAIAVDRDITGTGTPLRFFGADAPIPVGTFEVAIRAGAAIVPVVLERRGLRVHAYVYPEVHYDPTAPRDAEVTRVAQRVLAQFEEIIRVHPELWHVLEPIWDGKTAVRA